MDADDPNTWPVERSYIDYDYDAYLIAYANAYVWLTQCANGEIPHGGADVAV